MTKGFNFKQCCDPGKQHDGNGSSIRKAPPKPERQLHRLKGRHEGFEDVHD